MPRISDLPNMTTLDNTDSFPILDNTDLITKRISINTLGQGGKWITNDSIDDNTISPEKLSPVYCGSRISSSYTISNTSFTDTTLTVTLPSVGTWVISAHTRIQFTVVSTWGVLRLYNTTDNIDADSVTSDSSWSTGHSTTSGMKFVSSKTIICNTTVDNTVVAVQAKKGTSSNLTLLSDSDGYSSLICYKIG